MTMTTSNLPDYHWLNDNSKLFLERGYLNPGESPHSRIHEIANSAGDIIYKLSGLKSTSRVFEEKFRHYMARGYYSLSSPIWANFGRNRGLPISCFGSFIDDRMDSILSKTAEVGMMTKMGGGTSGYFGALRGRGSDISTGGKSSGPAHFMELFDTVTNVVSQSNVRRGSFAAYLPIEHPDILEFLHIRSDGHAIQNMSIGVTITDEWMKSMVEGDADKRKVWAKVIQKRFESGYPYIFFKDTVNRGKPEVYKTKGYDIVASNLCAEIALPSKTHESFVCNLSSMNLALWEEWKDTDAVEVLTFFLDAVMEEFITKTENIPYMYTAHQFAKKHRALGIGTLGWHTLLQSRMIPFESMDAKLLNTHIHRHIFTKAKEASGAMALFGEPEVMIGTGLRNTTLMAIAPTTSSSFILGQVSPSIEPLNSNYFVKDLAKGKFTFRNPHLETVLTTYEKNTEEVWRSILLKGGSVQHLEFLSDLEKAVFKTFGEISQKEIVIQAAGRQKFIDQSQSLNLMIHPKTSPKEVSQLLIFAWEQGVKTLYYQRGTNPAQELGRSLMSCSSCEA